MVLICGSSLEAGAVSRPFPARDLLRVAQQAHEQRIVLVLSEKCGSLSLGVECVWARLSPHVASPGAELQQASRRPADGEPQLRVCLRRSCQVGDELLLWPAPELCASVGVPHLTPRNIAADGTYVCWVCGARYSEPHPLKVHLFLQCGAPSTAAFWRKVCEALLPQGPPAPPQGPQAVPPQGPPAVPPQGPPRRHRCPWCGRLYSRRYGLVIHCRTHTGARPLRCPHCARRFADPSNLNKHRRLHDRDRERDRKQQQQLTQHSPPTTHNNTLNTNNTLKLLT